MFDYETALKSAGVDDADACMDWAFGDEWESLPIYQLDEAWNKRHGDLFVLNGCDRVIDGTEKIGRAYVSYINSLK